MSLPQWSSPCSGLCEGGITKALIFREKEEILLWPSSLWLRHSTASPLRLSHCSLWNGSWSFTPATSSNSAESYQIEMQVQNFLSFSIQDWTTPETQTVSPPLSLFPNCSVGLMVHQGISIQAFRVQPTVVKMLPSATSHCSALGYTVPKVPSWLQDSWKRRQTPEMSAERPGVFWEATSEWCCSECGMGR